MVGVLSFVSFCKASHFHFRCRAKDLCAFEDRDTRRVVCFAGALQVNFVFLSVSLHIEFNN